MVRNLELRAATNGIARNKILFVGDGMGVSTVTTARIMEGQSLGGAGEEHALSFEQFPNLALSKTYNTNQQIADSAALKVVNRVYLWQLGKFVQRDPTFIEQVWILEVIHGETVAIMTFYPMPQLSVK